MKALLRLYPRSWRRRYGKEMEVLLEEMRGEGGVSLDLVLGAAAAYATVVRGNRFLSAAAAYVHGVCVAVLVQAIAFVLFVMAGNNSAYFLPMTIGSVPIATFWRNTSLLGLRPLPLLASPVVGLTAAAMLAVLAAALAFLLTAPGWLKRAYARSRVPG